MTLSHAPREILHAVSSLTSEVDADTPADAVTKVPGGEGANVGETNEVMNLGASRGWVGEPIDEEVITITAWGQESATIEPGGMPFYDYARTVACPQCCGRAVAHSSEEVEWGSVNFYEWTACAACGVVAGGVPLRLESIDYASEEDDFDDDTAINTAVEIPAGVPADPIASPLPHAPRLTTIRGGRILMTVLRVVCPWRWFSSFAVWPRGSPT